MSVQNPPTKSVLVDPNKILLTRAEAAYMLSVGLSTLDRLAAEKEGPLPTRIGVSVRYHRDDINEWLRSCREEE